MMYELILLVVVMLLIGIGVAAQYRLMAKNALRVQIEAKRELESCRRQAQSTLSFDREAMRRQLHEAATNQGAQIREEGPTVVALQRRRELMGLAEKKAQGSTHAS
jgi:cytochrome c biogenesis protein ResB